MKMMKLLLLEFLSTFFLAVLVLAQEQTGFLSIDCGIAKGGDYTDATTGLNYVSDATFIDSGLGSSNKISSSLKTSTLAQQYFSLRSFAQGTKNCYTVQPSQLSFKFLIRASFMYGNYDGLNKLPQFDIQLGVETWDTIKFADSSSIVRKEIVHIPSSNYTYICLVNTGLGTPFISSIEVRPLKNDTYVSKSGSLSLFKRWNFGSSIIEQVRYPDDVYDRIWPGFDWAEMGTVNTSLTIDKDKFTNFRPPSIVMGTAVTPKNASESIKFYWNPADPTSQFYVYMHFAEVQLLAANQTREFNITLNGTVVYDRLRPDYLYTTSIYDTGPHVLSRFEYWIVRTENSTLPPLLNALEVFIVKQFLQSPTGQDEVDAMNNIKTLYGIERNWQGDPCTPEDYAWTGLTCSYDGYNSPQIISLNLSSSGLTGEIPSYISDLLSMQILDLSNNKLNGSVPGFLAQLPSLKVLYLTGNEFTGSVPAALVSKSNSGLLNLRVDGLSDCTTASCTSTEEKRSSSIVAPVIGGVIGGSVFIVLLSLFIWWFIRKQREDGKRVRIARNNGDESILVETKNRQFSYAEVLKMTNNFEKILGRGGFGSVFFGRIDDGTPVAVKMLSLSSVEGYKQFHAEVKLLMRVHHRNLTSLVGYCDEGDHKALVYEYMVKGDLEGHINDRSPTVLSWKERLCIAVDSAQGLEYLHNGCKPPIVHRDVKCTNILLNADFQAKIADFGLSRVFPVEGGSRVSTVVAGTPGYLDPEYYVSNRLHEKSDVFSFGVVILEIITSRPVISRDQDMAHISQWVANVLETQGDIGNIVDRRLNGEFDVSSMWKAVEIAMACVAHTANLRPSMSQVVIELKECLAMEMARSSRGTISSNTQSIDMASLNIDTGIAPLAR